MDALKLPLALYVAAVVVFPVPGIVLLLADGHWGSAALVGLSLAYAAGLGRALLWRRLGRPAVPQRRRPGR